MAPWMILAAMSAPSEPIFLDLAGQTQRQVVVDKEPGQYLGHPTTLLMPDGQTMFIVYPRGHGRGPIVLKRSTDAGRSWSERLPTPENWATSLETPTIHRLIGPDGKPRLVLWSGLNPARLATSEDDGATWSPLEPAGTWGGIVVMSSLERLADGRYVGLFHDDGRFLLPNAKGTQPFFTLYQTFSADGGQTWSYPEAIYSTPALDLCEPGAVRSPDGKILAMFVRENKHLRGSYLMYTKDECRSWSTPRELPRSLTGDRHVAKYAKDGRLVVLFRDVDKESPTWGDWVGWVGTWEDVANGRPGQYRFRLEDNLVSGDTAYSGLELLPDGSFFAATYGHWKADEEPYILGVRFSLSELDQMAAKRPAK